MIRKHLVLLLLILLWLGVAGTGAQSMPSVCVPTSSSRPTSRVLSANETKHILATTQHSLNDELSRTVLAQVFDFADGRALILFEDGTGRLYESGDDFRALLDEVERKARQGPVNPLVELLPQGQAFAEQVPQLLGQLPAQLDLDAAQLDGSEASLDKVDEALKRMCPQRVLTPDVFAPLTAYVGEVIRKAAKGRWEMRRGSGSETWEPWIVGPSGRSYAPFAVFKELYGDESSPCLRCFVAGTLGANLLGEPATTQVSAGASGPEIHTGSASAQPGPPTAPSVEVRLSVVREPEDGVVIGAPFSATAISETSQVLANGDHISQKTESNLFRDSQGRLRREEVTVTGSGRSTSFVVINDPVAGTSFVLHPEQKTAEQLRKPFAHTKGAGNDAPPDEMTNREGKELASANLKSEDLGTQIIAGLAVQGRRVTIPIPVPARQTGDENATPVVVETWYSNDLQTIVMSKRNDPWSGETTYKLTNIQRTEPDASLFAVPAGYTVTPVAHFR